MCKEDFQFLRQSTDQPQKQPESQRESDKSKFLPHRHSDEVHSQNSVQPRVMMIQKLVVGTLDNILPGCLSTIDIQTVCPG